MGGPILRANIGLHIDTEEGKDCAVKLALAAYFKETLGGSDYENQINELCVAWADEVLNRIKLVVDRDAYEEFFQEWQRVGEGGPQF